jgi:hypothetical protein
MVVVRVNVHPFLQDVALLNTSHPFR